MIYIFVSIVLAYLIGSIPTAYIFGKVLKGIDIRQYGSGNVGATNAARTIGKGPGIIVLILDFLKGFLVVIVMPLCLRALIPDFFIFYGFVYPVLGLAVISGHIWTCFLSFKGGKGVATTAGVMAGLSAGIFLACLAVWGIIFLIWKYVSLASIVAAVSLPIFAVIFGKDLSFILFCVILCMGGVYTHRSNIKRLIQGNETRIVKV